MEKTQVTFNQETQSHVCPGLVFKSGVGGAHAGPAISCSHPLPLAPSSYLHTPFTPTGPTPRTRKKGWSPENSGLGALTCSNTPGPSLQPAHRGRPHPAPAAAGSRPTCRWGRGRAVGGCPQEESGDRGKPCPPQHPEIDRGAWGLIGSSPGPYRGRS